MMNPEDTVALLQICDLAKQWPKLNSVHDLAMAQLIEANDEAKDWLVKRADEKAKAAAEAKAKAEAEAKAESDARTAAAAQPQAVPASTVDRRPE